MTNKNNKSKLTIDVRYKSWSKCNDLTDYPFFFRRLQDSIQSHIPSSIPSSILTSIHKKTLPKKKVSCETLIHH